MKIIEPSVKLMRDFDGDEVLKFIELCGRTAYKSEQNITENSAEKFVRNIIKRGHESVLEHFSCTFKIICDRGVSHEIVRHRLASFTQESTRYCNYASEKFGSELTFIVPRDSLYDKPFSQERDSFVHSARTSEKIYKFLIDECYITPQEARAILPNSLKTEIVMTCNLREWRHFLKLRTAKDAHPQMRQVANMILDILKQKLPVIFEDIGNDKNSV